MDITRIDGIIKYYELSRKTVETAIPKITNDEKATEASKLVLKIFEDTIHLINIAKMHIQTKNIGDNSNTIIETDVKTESGESPSE